MEPAFQDLMSFFMTNQCYEKIFHEFNIEPSCLKLVISKCLSYGILAGSFGLRLPQIIKILKAGSGAGLSVISEILMILSVFGSLSYGYYKNFPFSSFGESYFLYAQSNIVLLLCLFYSSNFLLIIISVTVFTALPGLLFQGLLPVEVIMGFNGFSVVLAVVSKLIQAASNFQNGSTGNLSAITLLLQFGGCVARIFTNVQETGDFAMILQYTILTAVNGILVAQLLWYWNASIETNKLKNKKKQ
jgi:mannose-P-dolichol utilization defect 1